MKIVIDYKLYDARRNKSLTVRELEALSGVSKSMINCIENNNANPSVITMCQLAVALGVEPKDLYTYKAE
jgi:transcriptional regulator with XRE-family HTH domain